MIGFLDRRKHDRLRTLLSSFADEEVSEGEKRQVEAHLAQCPECSAELASIRSMSQLMSRLPEIALPRSFLLTHAPAPAQQSSYGLWSGSLATAAAAVLLVFLLVGDSFGLVSQSPMPLRESGSQPAIAPAAPAAAPMAPAAPAAAVPAPSELGSASEPGIDSPAAPAPAQAVPAPAAAAAAPAPAAPALAGAGNQAAPAPLATTTEEPLDETSSRSAPDASEEPSAPAAAAPLTALTADVTPSHEVGLESLAQLEFSAETQEPVDTAAQNELRKALQLPPQLEAPVVSQSLNEEQVPLPPGEPGLLGPGIGGALETAPPSDDLGRDESPSDGISIPLHQLQIAVGAILVVLLSTTAYLYRRR